MKPIVNRSFCCLVAAFFARGLRRSDGRRICQNTRDWVGRRRDIAECQCEAGTLRSIARDFGCGRRPDGALVLSTHP